MLDDGDARMEEESDGRPAAENELGGLGPADEDRSGCPGRRGDVDRVVVAEVEFGLPAIGGEGLRLRLRGVVIPLSIIAPPNVVGAGAAGEMTLMSPSS